MSSQLAPKYNEMTINMLIQLQEQGSLNLEPGFQRKSVWALRDRQKLIESILSGYPIPSIFLYLRMSNGKVVYDVIDGKQRLESIFMFRGARRFGRKRFAVKHQFDVDEKPWFYDWSDLEYHNLTGRVLTYRIQIVEVEGELSDIVDLFVRLNSTGKALTPAEKRNARFISKSPLFDSANVLVKTHSEFLIHNKVISAPQRKRMKDVELVCELLTSVVNGGPINKKAAVDRIIANDSLRGNALKKHVAEFGRAMTATKRFFPGLRSSRYCRISEFYTLFMLVWEFQQQGLVLSQPGRINQAVRVLSEFACGVDQARHRQVQMKGPKPHPLCVDYLFTVQQGTDSLQQRTRRAAIMRGLLAGIFEKRDVRRIFSAEQRRLIWNSRDQKKCSVCRCQLDWNNFEIDHIKPFSKGGKTTQSNAALICKRCNAASGARSRKRKAKARGRR